MEITLTRFTGGLALKVSADELEAHQLQDATNVDFTKEPGVVGTRRGIDKSISTLYEVDANLFWQKAFAISGLMIRSGDDLYDVDLPIYSRLDDREMRFTEFGDWIILVNGVENLKYRRSGSNLRWHTAYTSRFERDFVTTVMGAAVLPFLYSDRLAPEIYCSYSWERKLYENFLTFDSEQFVESGGADFLTIREAWHD